MGRRGRPPIEDPRDHKFRLRMNNKEYGLLKEASEITGWSTSDILREGVRRIVEDARKTEKRILDAFDVEDRETDET